MRKADTTVLQRSAAHLNTCQRVIDHNSLRNRLRRQPSLCLFTERAVSHNTIDWKYASQIYC